MIPVRCWDSLGELSQLLFPPSHGGERRLGLLTGYYDRSTLGASDREVFAVAGAVAPNVFWLYDFAMPWAVMLDRYGVPEFHMTDFENRQGYYKDWPEERRVQFIVEALESLERAKLIGSGVALDLQAYRALSPSEQEYLGHPYKFCSSMCLRRMNNLLMEMGISDPVAYLFEMGDEGGGGLLDAVNGLTSERRRYLRLQSLTFAEKERFPQFQVADLIVYELAKSAVRDLGLDNRPHRKSLQILLRVFHGPAYLFDAITLRKWIDGGIGPLD
jgi:hypothetical protein